MSSADQPYIDPSEIALEESAAQPWINRIAILLGCVFGPLFF
ncbi:hypothetical protein [Polynucleobacter necessarius]|nr:hypothetical protein [Polynucleobacter necessarius]